MCERSYTMNQIELPSKWRMVRLSTLVVIVLSGCEAQVGSGPEVPNPPQTVLSFAAHIQPIFTGNCAFASGCHAGPNPQQGMNLSAGQAYSNVVNVFSNQVPRLRRIEPNNPDSSYLVLKLQGVAGSVGGLGTRMPLGGQLTQAQIDTVRAWVAGGALNN